MATEFLDTEGIFRFGKHRGESIEYIVSQDPDYIRWILRACEDQDEEERSIMETLMTRRGDTEWAHR